MSSKGVTPVVATALLIGIALSTVASAAVFMEDSFEKLTQTGKDVVNENQKQEEAEMSIETGYEQGGYILLRVRNTGKVALPVNQSDSIFAVYVEGRPKNGWEFLSDREVLGAGSIMTVNSSEPFPSRGNSTELEVVGPYETDSAIVCFNDGGASC